SYDNRGNLTSDGENDYQWNDRNRLSSIRRSGIPIANFQYDSLGRRIAKTVGTASGPATTGFVYDHENAVQELSGATNNASVKSNEWTGELAGVFPRLEGTAGASLGSVLSDDNNNTLALLDGTQATVVNYTYEPYGVSATDTPNDNPVQYAGRENDNP